MTSWLEPDADPLADISRWKEQVLANSPNWHPNVLWIGRGTFLWLSYSLHRHAIGKPVTKRSFRRWRAKMRSVAAAAPGPLVPFSA